MAKKVILKDWDNVEILPITRGELILDSSGNEALHSNEFLATTSQPGLMSSEYKIKLDALLANGGSEEIHIGDEAPTDPSIKVWIDTSVENVESNNNDSSTHIVYVAENVEDLTLQHKQANIKAFNAAKSGDLANFYVVFIDDPVIRYIVSMYDYYEELSTFVVSLVQADDWGTVTATLYVSVHSDGSIEPLQIGNSLIPNDLLQKLYTIEEGAQKNVQSDWNETNVNSAAFIKNKPLIKVETDTAMSSTSVNPVQNKTIKEYVDNIAKTLDTNKVDKVNGKQLSTEDFTTALKTKLESIGNYDDSTLAESLEELRRDFNTLVNGDTSTSIDSYNDLISFFEGVNDSSKFKAIIASLEQTINSKQNQIDDLENLRLGAAKGLTSVQQIIVNGETLSPTNGVVNLGSVSGDVDTTNIVTKEEFNKLVSEVLTNEEVHAEALVDLESRKTDKTYVDYQIYTINQHIEEAISPIEGEIINNEEIHAAALNDLNKRKPDKTYIDTSISNVDERLSDLNQEFIGDELVHAAALNDINTRKVDKSLVDNYIETTDTRISDVSTELSNSISFNERVHATALNDLNTRKTDQTYVDDSIDAVNSYVSQLNQKLTDDELIYSTAFNDLNTRKTDKEYVDDSISEANQLTTNVSDRLSELYDEVLVNEEVHASAFNDIDTRKTDKTYVDGAVNDINEDILTLTQELVNDELIHSSTLIDINNKKASKEYVDNSITTYSESVEKAVESFETLENNLTDYEFIHASALIDLENRKAEKSYVDHELRTFLSEFIKFKNEGVPVIEVTDTTVRIEPNKYYKWTNDMTEITVNLYTPALETNTLNNYMFEFRVSSSGCTLTVPSGIKWANGEPPELKVNKTYQVSIINNLAVTSMFG